MIVVCDMGPLHYLVLIGTEHVLPRLFTRVLAPSAVIAEMSHADAPEAVRLWASAPPPWLEIKEPDRIEEIPALGRKGSRGAGEKAAIALALQEGADAILMDDKDGQREAGKRGLRPLWMLTVLDQAAAQGFVSDLPERLDQLVRTTTFYVRRECRQVIEGMKQRDRDRKLAREQGLPARPPAIDAIVPSPVTNPSDRDFAPRRPRAGKTSGGPVPARDRPAGGRPVALTVDGPGDPSAGRSAADRTGRRSDRNGGRYSRRPGFSLPSPAEGSIGPSRPGARGTGPAGWGTDARAVRDGALWRLTNRGPVSGPRVSPVGLSRGGWGRGRRLAALVSPPIQ